MLSIKFKSRRSCFRTMAVYESHWPYILLRTCFTHIEECACSISLLHPPHPPSHIPWPPPFFLLCYWTEACRWTQTAGLPHISSHDLPDNSLRAHTWEHIDSHAHGHHKEKGGKKKKRDQNGAPGLSLEALQRGDAAAAAVVSLQVPSQNQPK